MAGRTRAAPCMASAVQKECSYFFACSICVRTDARGPHGETNPPYDECLQLDLHASAVLEQESHVSFDQWGRLCSCYSDSAHSLSVSLHTFHTWLTKFLRSNECYNGSHLNILSVFSVSLASTGVLWSTEETFFIPNYNQRRGRRAKLSFFDNSSKLLLRRKEKEREKWKNMPIEASCVVIGTLSGHSNVSLVISHFVWKVRESRDFLG